MSPRQKVLEKIDENLKTMSRDVMKRSNRMFTFDCEVLEVERQTDTGEEQMNGRLAQF